MGGTIILIWEASSRIGHLRRIEPKLEPLVTACFDGYLKSPLITSIVITKLAVTMSASFTTQAQVDDGITLVLFRRIYRQSPQGFHPATVRLENGHGACRNQRGPTESVYFEYILDVSVPKLGQRM